MGDAGQFKLEARTSKLEASGGGRMLFTFETRPSDSPFVETVWRTRGERAGPFISIATSRWELVVTRRNGTTTVYVRGPETKATPLYFPAEGEWDWVGIRFKVGTVMPHLPASSLVDGLVELTEAGDRAFLLQGAAWQMPGYEDADAFVERLVRRGMLVRDPIVEAALRDELDEVSIRTAQRHFLRTTGLTRIAVSQIERARRATTLLQQGVSISGTVHELGYVDQSHLNRALKRFIGLTPAEIRDADHAPQLSL
jgi:AraC-like DNA-binding protein